LATKISIEFVNTHFTKLFGSTAKQITDNPSEWFLKKMFYSVDKLKALAIDETAENYFTTMGRAMPDSGSSKAINLIDIFSKNPEEIGANFYLVKGQKTKAQAARREAPKLISPSNSAGKEDEEEIDHIDGMTVTDFIF
jgi:hypothetical protein